GRIDMELVSLREQSFGVAGRCFRFAAGEAIHTEHSHKHTVEGFASVAAGAGFDLRRVWTDDREWFAVMHLVVEAEPPASPR
ncbi:MAG: L-histidine N(alpha)-methyltransferase, partial [Planctomycetota bacterium]